MDSEKIRVFQYMPEGCGNPVVYDDLDQCLAGVKEDIGNSEIGDSYVIELREMTREEIDNLPEHGGW